MKAKTKLFFIDRIFLWINYLLCAALLFSYLAAHVDPRKFWLPAFFGLAYLVLLTLNVLIIFYWLLRKKWQFLLSLITIIIGWNIFLNNFSLHFGNSITKPKLAGDIRVMTYNAHNFRRYGAKIDTSTRAEVLSLIKQQQPDIIGFQEYFSRKSGKYDFNDSIKKVLNVNYFYFEHFTLNRHQTIGMAIFSRYPIISKGIIALADTTSENQCLYVDVKKDNEYFRFYSVHLQSIGFDPEDYKYIDSVSEKGKTDFRSTERVGSKLINAFLKRSEQMYKVKNNSLLCKYPYIISGDFNDTPSSFVVNQMAKGLKNAFREKGFGFGRTYNGDFPNFQIDYIMASPQFDVSDYQIIPKKLSDHYPVRSDLRLVH